MAPQQQQQQQKEEKEEEGKWWYGDQLVELWCQRNMKNGKRIWGEP